jgi:hypothetical protein
MIKPSSFFREPFFLFAILLIVLGTATFGSLSELMLDAYDDRDHMVDTPHIIDDWTFMFSTERLVEIRPPIDVLFLLGYLCWGENPAGYHLIEVVLHIVATLVLVFAFRALGADRLSAYVSALFFFMNVSHHRAIHQITTVTFLLALIFGLLVVISFNRFLIDRARVWILLALLFLAISVFSHPTMISVVLFCCYMSWRKEQSITFVVRSVWPLGLGSSILVFLVFLASWHGDQLQGVVARPDLDLILSKPFWYLGRLWGNAHWIGPSLFQGNPAAWEIALGLLYCLCALLLYRRKIFPAADWAVWSCVMILPFLNYPLSMLGIGPSRHLYIPSAGSSFVLVWGIQYVVRRCPTTFQKTILISILACFMVSSFVSLKRVEAYSYYQSGRGYIAQGDYELGERQLSKAIQIDVSIVPKDIFERYAFIALWVGKPAWDVLDLATRLHPNSKTLLMLSGLTLLQKNDKNAAIEGWQRIVRANEISERSPDISLDTALALTNLAKFYYRQADYDLAAFYFEKVLIFNSESETALSFLGQLNQSK